MIGRGAAYVGSLARACVCVCACACVRVRAYIPAKRPKVPAGVRAACKERKVSATMPDVMRLMNVASPDGGTAPHRRDTETDAHARTHARTHAHTHAHREKESSQSLVTKTAEKA